ncbi:hypothetical protein GOL43_27140 [Sinorhizobium medicae]|nr:hypothetical protein [Sinorhizobium medicae]
MRRRDMLVGSTALVAITLASTSRAQNTIVGDIILPLTRERLLSILSDPGRFSLAVDTLRLTLMLSHPATEMANVNFDEVNADYRQRLMQVRQSIERVAAETANLPDLLPPLSDQLEEAVRRAATRLVEVGIAAGAALLREMIDSFWSFLFVLERISGAGAVVDWICGSFPFSVLC